MPPNRLIANFKTFDLSSAWCKYWTSQHCLRWILRIFSWISISAKSIFPSDKSRRVAARFRDRFYMQSQLAVNFACKHAPHSPNTDFNFPALQHRICSTLVQHWFRVLAEKLQIFFRSHASSFTSHSAFVCTMQCSATQCVIFKCSFRAHTRAHAPSHLLFY